MEKNAQIQRWQDFDYTKSVERSENRCKKYIQENFGEYKQEQTVFAPGRMDKIVTEGDNKLGRNCMEYIHTTKDEQQDGFFQYSIKKRDLPRLVWLIKNGNIKYHSAKEYNDFIKLLVEQLSPSKEEKEWKEGDLSLEESKKTRNTVYVLFKTIIDAYKTHEGFQPYGKSLVEEMMGVNLEHEKYSTSFTIDEELLIPFLPSDQDKSVVLRDMYQKTVDKERGDTFAHVFARQHKSDKLHQLIENDYIDPILNEEDKDVVGDKKGLTFFDIVFGEFDKMNPLDFNTDPEKAQKIACCYHMSLKYIMLKQKNWKDFDATNNCACGKHPIVRKDDGVLCDPVDLEENIIDKFAAATALKVISLLGPEESKCARCCSNLLKRLRAFWNGEVDEEAVPFWS